MSIFKGTKNELSVPCVAHVLVDNGKTMQDKFKVRFKVLPLSEAKDLLENVGEEEGNVTDRDILREHILEITNLKDGNDQVVAYADYEDDGQNKVLEEMLEHAAYLNALIGGFRKAQFGDKANMLKN